MINGDPNAFIDKAYSAQEIFYKFKEEEYMLQGYTADGQFHAHKKLPQFFPADADRCLRGEPVHEIEDRGAKEETEESHRKRIGAALVNCLSEKRHQAVKNGGGDRNDKSDISGSLHIKPF